MTLYLVRHAKAGSRTKWDGPDDRRPVSKPGRRQSIAIADTLVDAGITKIVTSPFMRCRQTVEPLAGRVGVTIDLSDALGEGAGLDESLVVVDKAIDENAVLCTHGDVLGNLLAHFERHGAHLDGEGLEKGSMWVLDVVEGAVVAGSYVPPPS